MIVSSSSMPFDEEPLQVSPSSITKDAEPQRKGWFSDIFGSKTDGQLSNQEDARDEGDSKQDEAAEDRHDDATQISDNREFHGTVSTVKETDSMVSASFEHVQHPSCTNEQAKCGIKLPDREQVKEEFAAFQTTCGERRPDGIDVLFDFVESALCGDITRKCNGKTETMVNNLPEYTMPTLPKDLTEDESEFSQDERKSRSSKYYQSSGNKRSRKRRTKPSTRRRKSRPSKVVEEKPDETPANSTPDLIQDVIETKPTDEITKNIKVEPVPEEKGPSPAPFSGKGSAFEDLSTAKQTNNTALTEAVTEASRSISGMRDLCVLSIGSGSSVSSFDAQSWSRHSKKKAVHAEGKVARPATRNFTTILLGVFKFIFSLTSDLVGTGALPVNKGFCLIASLVLLVLWPEAGEKDRLKVERKDPPKPPKQASLLNLVTSGRAAPQRL